MQYGFGLQSTRFPAGPQRSALIAFGVSPKRVIIEDRQASEEFKYLAVTSLRTGEGDIVAVHRFHLLAPGVSELRRRIRAIHAKEATIVEVETGRQSNNCDHIAEMIFEAFEVYTGRLLDPQTAAEMGRKGAKNSPVTKKRRGHRPIKEAQPIWRDLQYKDWRQALAAVNADDSYRPYSKTFAYKRLGKRFASPGRPTK